jgi:hypothetical protein
MVSLTFVSIACRSHAGHTYKVRKLNGFRCKQSSRKRFLHLCIQKVPSCYKQISWTFYQYYICLLTCFLLMRGYNLSHLILNIINVTIFELESIFNTEFARYFNDLSPY